DILQTLQQNGLADDTIVIFNADHGDYMGAFSLLLKGPFPHASVNRVPFIWVDPSHDDASIAEGLAASIDIAPTILERCGVRPYYGIQGKSFLSQIGGRSDGRATVLIEHEENKVYPGLNGIPNIRNLITPSHRLSVYKGQDAGELYDLEADPHETRNLWDEPDCLAIKSDLLFQLSQAMLDAIEPGPKPQRYA
ncbi:MAG: sulfatase/phosphatase domain-containing protein, partial [Pseudomonadota bacterium]|nr:sulfatase/phosphatase domain-containing protein [Pseudomonadota bacterium]